MASILKYGSEGISLRVQCVVAPEAFIGYSQTILRLLTAISLTSTPHFSCNDLALSIITTWKTVQGNLLNEMQTETEPPRAISAIVEGECHDEARSE
jgi:hypothetical protein